MYNEENTTNKPPKKPQASREIEVICWLDNPIHRENVNILLKDKRCVGILHDKDITEEGTPKKPHYHIIIKFENASTFGSVLKLIPNHEESNMRLVKSMKGACRYLLHLDNPEKAQYVADELVGNTLIAKRYINDVDKENDDVRKIILRINSSTEYVRLSDLMLWACEEGLYATLRRNSYMFTAIINEFNREQDFKRNRERFIDEL